VTNDANNEGVSAPHAKSPDKPAIVVNGLDVSDLTIAYVRKLRAAGVDCWHKTMNGLVTFSDAWSFVDNERASIQIARTVVEIHQAQAAGQLALVLGWQDANTIAGGKSGPNNWWSDPPRTELRAFYELGLRIAGIAYQIANTLGGGAIDGNIGLTRAGQKYVEQVHALRIILDVGGHTGDSASLEAISISKGVPIICSHGATRHLADSTRNLSDEVIDAIAGTGGVIGIPAISDFVIRGKQMALIDSTPLATVDHMTAHADYLKHRIGAQHVALGPDFTEGSDGRRDRTIFGADAIDVGLRRFVAGFESISGLPAVVQSLRMRGWTSAEIRGFLGENWLRVYRQVWGC
jgi:membrane dipeptidase